MIWSYLNTTTIFCLYLKPARMFSIVRREIRSDIKDFFKETLCIVVSFLCIWEVAANIRVLVESLVLALALWRIKLENSTLDVKSK